MAATSPRPGSAVSCSSASCSPASTSASRWSRPRRGSSRSSASARSKRRELPPEVRRGLDRPHQAAVRPRLEGLETEARATSRSTSATSPASTSDYTYHVDRGQFDMLLLQHAHELGAQVYEGVRVKHVDFAGDPPEIQFAIGGKDGDERLRPAWCVDASGRRTAARQPARAERSRTRSSTSTPSTPGSTATTAARGDAKSGSTTSTSTSCRSRTPGSGRSRSPTTSPASAW